MAERSPRGREEAGCVALLRRSDSGASSHGVPKPAMFGVSPGKETRRNKSSMATEAGDGIWAPEDERMLKI